MDKRKIEEKIFKYLMISSTAAIIGTLALIIGSVIVKGAAEVSVNTFINDDVALFPGEEHGILHAIIGSLYLAINSTVISFLISFPVAIYSVEYMKKKSLSPALTISIETLMGVPSIVFGMFGLFVFVLVLTRGFTLLAGTLTLALLELPLMERGIEEVVRMVPVSLKEASYALGATTFETIKNIVLKQALPGIVTVSLISFGRGIGEAAPVMLTAGFNPFPPASLLEPAASLPLAVYTYLSAPGQQGKAYASAFTLTIIVLIISLISRYVSKRFTRYVSR